MSEVLHRESGRQLGGGGGRETGGGTGGQERGEREREMEGRDRQTDRLRWRRERGREREREGGRGGQEMQCGSSVRAERSSTHTEDTTTGDDDTLHAHSKAGLVKAVSRFGSVVVGCRLTCQGQAETNAEAWFNIASRPRKPEGSLGRTAQDGHLDSHTAPELA